MMKTLYKMPIILSIIVIVLAVIASFGGKFGKNSRRIIETDTHFLK